MQELKISWIFIDDIFLYLNNYSYFKKCSYFYSINISMIDDFLYFIICIITITIDQLGPGYVLELSHKEQERLYRHVYLLFGHMLDAAPYG